MILHRLIFTIEHGAVAQKPVRVVGRKTVSYQGTKNFQL